jgi:hypothetical protein
VTWTYTSDSTAYKDKVRFLVQDTDTNDQLVSDEEIAFALAQNSNIYRAAAIVARSIGLKLSRELTLNPAPGGVSLDSQAQAEKYLALAKELADQATAQGAASIFAGGISIADKTTREEDTDRPVPSFTLKTHEQSKYDDLTSRAS